MSRNGHLLTGACLAGSIAALHGSFEVAGGVVAAASAPDALEIVVGFGWFTGKRLSIIPHRTITHWPIFWLILAIGAALARVDLGPVHLNLILVGIAAGALLHILLDAFSPSGVPLLNPFGAHVSFGPFRSGRARFLYRTGESDEFYILGPAALVTAALIFSVYELHGFHLPH